MKFVPKYLMPRIATTAAPGPTTNSTTTGDGENGVDGRRGDGEANDVGFVPFRKPVVRGRGRGRGRGGRGGFGGKKKSDPLKKFGR